MAAAARSAMCSSRATDSRSTTSCSRSEASCRAERPPLNFPPRPFCSKLRRMDLIAAALANPINRKILERLPLLGAPNACLVAGSVYQAYWNALSDHPVAEGVKDYDLFYFDADDLSYEAEDAVIRRAATLFADLD